MSFDSGLRPEAARRWLALVLLLSLCINSVGIRWGLPNTDGTWAADSLGPTTPMAIAKHALGGDPPNSGWFYFKYPLGHPLLLAAVQLPYLAWLKLTRQFDAPKGEYPYGFHHPDRAVLVLALLMRAVSVVMGVGIVALAYVTACALFDRLAGLFAAALVGGCYPVVFYAHTSNVDVALLFWVALAIAGALSAARTESVRAATVTGAAAAMALLTKEQSLGALAALPIVWVLRRPAGAATWSSALRHAAAAALAALAVTVIVGNLWWNPAGYVNRWRFLLGTLPPEVREKYAPYQFLVQVPAGFSLQREAEHLRKAAGVVAHALSLPVAFLCVAGVLWALWRQPRRAAVPLVTAAIYYVLTLRAATLLPVRYTIPLLYLCLIFAGAGAAACVQAAARLQQPAARPIAAVLAVAVLALALLPGIDVDRLLLKDPRYVAEGWLRAHAGPRERVEIYEPRTYLPRFDPVLRVTRVPVDERTVERFQERRPDLVVLSSGGHAGLTGSYVRDWQPGKPVFAELDGAKTFIDALRGERLGYRLVARFQTPTRWITPRINSLNPEITIYAAAERADLKP